MRWIFVIIPVILVRCTNATRQASDSIPLPVSAYLQAHLPGWQIVDTADYAKSWWSFHDKSQFPGFITTDLNDDRLPDHALLLKKNNELGVVILMGTTNGTFIHRIAAIFPYTNSGQGKTLQMGLAVEPPGQIDVVYPKERTLVLTSNGITLLELENTYHVYYWQNGTIQTFYAK